jgi:hypothetical protein
MLKPLALNGPARLVVNANHFQRLVTHSIVKPIRWDRPRLDLPAIAESDRSSFEGSRRQQPYDFNDSGKYMIRCGRVALGDMLVGFSQILSHLRSN